MANINWYESLVVMSYDQATDLAAFHEEMQHWERWLTNAVPFCMMRVFNTTAALSSAPAVAAAMTTWRSQQLPAIQRTLTSIAVVFTAPDSDQRLRNLQVEKLFGVPGAVFATTTEALVWLRQRPENHHLLLPEVIHE